MENEAACEDITEQYENELTEDYEQDGLLAEESVVVMELSEEEAGELEKEDEITLVEKDIEITASGRTKSQKRWNPKVSEKAETETENNDEVEWNLKMIGIQEKVREQVSDGEKVKVAILDSGVEVSEEVNVVDRINLVAEEDYIPEYLEDVTGHGTSVAGLISDIVPNAEI